MPELPEVETMRRGVEPVTGCRIRGLRRPRSRLQPIAISPRLSDFRRRVLGRKIVAVERLGKRVVVELDGPGGEPSDRIVFEPRMSGLVLLADPPVQRIAVTAPRSTVAPATRLDNEPIRSRLPSMSSKPSASIVTATLAAV